jgi:hypothetical protein
MNLLANSVSRMGSGPLLGVLRESGISIVLGEKLKQIWVGIYEGRYSVLIPSLSFAPESR